MAVRIVQYLIFICFLCITCNSVDSDRRFIRQLDVFKREVRNDLSYISIDINTLFESFDGINKTLRNNINENIKGMPDDNNRTHADKDKNKEQCMVKNTLFDGLSEKYIVLQKAFESEKQLNRELQDRLQSFESGLKSFESEKQFTRQLQDRINRLESEKHEVQNSIKAVEDSISGIYEDVVANMTSFTNDVKESLEDSVRDIDGKLSNGISISCNANSQSGLFNVFMESIGTVKSVYCDAKTEGGGWTVIMRRQHGSVDFNRSWTEYKNGFGNADGEFWLGNDVIHGLTKSTPRELRIDMHDFNGKKVYAKYDTFEIGPESDKYRLNVDGYSGTAGDAMVDPPYKSIIHNGMKFTTFDSDNDIWSGNCASKYPGGWWFKSCFGAHLTAIYSHVSKIRYAHGIIWAPWKGYTIALKFVEMKIR